MVDLSNLTDRLTDFSLSLLYVICEILISSIIYQTFPATLYSAV